MRIMVEGSRGKTGIVKMLVDTIYKKGEIVMGKVTGKDPLIFYDNNEIPIKRQRGMFFLDVENKKILKKYSFCKYKIFENQALSAYTMGLMHHLFKPDIVVIPNIRYEHQDQLGDTIEEMAKSFAVNFKNIKTVITTENKEEVLTIFRQYANKYNTDLIIIDCKEDIPGIQAHYLTKKVISYIGLGDLSDEEHNNLKNNLEQRMCPKTNSHGLTYFIGSKINDIESCENVINYLKSKGYNKIKIVAYFRKDRSERTFAFKPLLHKLTKDDSITDIYLSGHNVGYVGNSKTFKYYKEKDFKNIIADAKKNKELIFTAVNGANAFMKSFEKLLEE